MSGIWTVFSNYIGSLRLCRLAVPKLLPEELCWLELYLFIATYWYCGFFYYSRSKTEPFLLLAKLFFWTLLKLLEKLLFGIFLATDCPFYFGITNVFL